MKKGILVSILALVMLSVMAPAAVLAADAPNVDKDMSGYQALNPGAQQAAQVVGYGNQTNLPYCAPTVSCGPSFYLNNASKMAAGLIGYYEPYTIRDFAIPEPSKNPDLPVLNQ